MARARARRAAASPRSTALPRPVALTITGSLLDRGPRPRWRTRRILRMSLEATPRAPSPTPSGTCPPRRVEPRARVAPLQPANREPSAPPKTRQSRSSEGGRRADKALAAYCLKPPRKIGASHEPGVAAAATSATGRPSACLPALVRDRGPPPNSRRLAICYSKTRAVG